MSRRQFRVLIGLLVCSGILGVAARLQAIPEADIRRAVQKAEECERSFKWEEAREIYELLLSQKDLGLRIRDRYQNAQRRCWQLRRHQDLSYRKEVLSVDFGQAIRLHKIISKSLLEGSIEKKNITPTKLFHKGLEEFDAALADPAFLEQHVPVEKRALVPQFRAALRKAWGDKAKLTREEATEQIGEIALAAEFHLGLSTTVVAMEFACGACYAIDEYTVYLTPNQLRELARTLARAEAIGVGLSLTLRDNRIVVGDVMMESPAALAEINVGDQIVSVNKKAVADLPLLSVKELLEGPLGSMVEIEILRPDGNVRMLRLVRQRADVPSVIAFVWAHTDYGYLKINSFTSTTPQDVDKALAEFSKASVKGVILDLRDNNGGAFDSAIDTAQRFLATGIITSRQHKDPSNNFVYHARNPKASTLPMVVLVDGDTASAAELLAGALKDNNRAYLIGQKTYGKGCTQCLLKLPNTTTGNVPTGGMRLTVARFFSPKGEPYSGRGVLPHFLIEDAMAGSQAGMMGGPYLAKAIDELNRMTIMQK